MTRDDIIRMAHEAGITYVTGHGVASATFEWLDRFASLVAEREREACARMVEPVDGSLADEIRARGEK
jgi:hypothetical protein